MKNAKVFISGVLAGALCVTAPAIAGGIKQLIEAELNTVNVTVDGVKVDGENILYNDRTYVPLRQIAEMLGKDVAWDDATNTADIADHHDNKDNSSALLEMYVSLANAQNDGISQEEALSVAKENLAFDEALLSFAKENGVEADEEFEASYKNYISSMDTMYGGEGAFTQLIGALGYTEASYKRIQTVAYVKAKLIQKNEALYAPKGDEITEYYTLHKEDFKYDGLRAKHILFSTVKDDGTDITASEAKVVEKKAYEIYNKIKHGSDFDTLMNTYSEDPGLISNPDGYTFTRGEMVKEFEDAAYNLNIGKVSAPIKSSYGYHIIKLEEKIEYLDLTNESVKNYVSEQIKTEKLNADVISYMSK